MCQSTLYTRVSCKDDGSSPRLANQAYGLIRAGMLDRGTKHGLQATYHAHPVACPEDPPSEMTIQFSLTKFGS
jgi:hypothetical protein